MERGNDEKLDSTKINNQDQRVDTPSSGPKNGRTGRVLLPNANTYWSGHGWVRESRKLEQWPKFGMD